MAMTTAQRTAFDGASGIAAADLSGFVTALFATIMLIWLAWLVYGAYHAWTDGHIDVFEGSWWILRAAFWVTLMTWLVR